MHGSHITAARSERETSLVLGFAELLWVLCVVWVWMGLPAVLATGVFLNFLMIRAEHSKQRERGQRDHSACSELQPG